MIAPHFFSIIIVACKFLIYKRGDNKRLTTKENTANLINLNLWEKEENLSIVK